MRETVPELLIITLLVSVVILPLANVRVPFTVALPEIDTPVALLILRPPKVFNARPCAPAPAISTVRFVRVLLVIVYWPRKSLVPVARVTFAVPLPVRVPLPPTRTLEAGLRTALALTVRLPPVLKLVFAVTGAEVLETVRLLNVVVVLPPIAWADVPLRVTVLLVAVNVPLFEKSPLISCVNAPVVNDVPEPTVKLPVVLTAAPAVAAAEPDIAKLPATVVVETGIVFVLVPLNVRFPYVSAVTVWAAPP